MIILYIIVFLAVTLNIYVFINLEFAKLIYKSHSIAHTSKYSNNAKFNEAFNIVSFASMRSKDYLKPFIDIDNSDMRNILFMNNINSVALSINNKLAFDLNLKSVNNATFFFITDNYKVNEEQKLANNIISSNFPKLYENDIEYYQYINLKELGYSTDVKIKADDIVIMIFNGKNRELSVLTNDINQTAYHIRYKSKKDMVSRIKETALYKHIMQWGIPGFADSMFTYYEGSSQQGNIEEDKDLYRKVIQSKKNNSLEKMGYIKGEVA